MLIVLAWLAPVLAQVPSLEAEAAPTSSQVLFLGPQTKAVLKVVRKRLARPDLLPVPVSAWEQPNPALANDSTLPGFGPTTRPVLAADALSEALSGQIRVQSEPEWVPRLDSLVPVGGELFIAIPESKPKRTQVWKYLPETHELLFVNV